MEKDFDRWNKVKKAINATDEQGRLYFHEGDIWWVHLGVNVGYEIDGKSSDFSRPVIILRKYNQYSFLALPLTTNAKPNKWRVPIGSSLTVMRLRCSRSCATSTVAASSRRWGRF